MSTSATATTNAGADVLDVVRSVRRFAATYAYNLPGQLFIERSAAAREVPFLLLPSAHSGV